jgi:hypothetical protein
MVVLLFLNTEEKMQRAKRKSPSSESLVPCEDNRRREKKRGKRIPNDKHVLFWVLVVSWI